MPCFSVFTSMTAYIGCFETVHVVVNPWAAICALGVIAMQKMGPRVLVSTVAPICLTASTPACAVFSDGGSPVRWTSRITTAVAPAFALHTSAAPIVDGAKVALVPSTVSSSAGVASAHALPCPKAANELAQAMDVMLAARTRAYITLPSLLCDWLAHHYRSVFSPHNARRFIWSR